MMDSEWVAYGISNRVIPLHTRLLVCDQNGDTFIAVFDYGDNCFYPACKNEPDKPLGAFLHITYWMPIPEPPEQPFYLEKRGGPLTGRIPGKWGIHHRTYGWVGDMFDEFMARAMCRRLNAVWRGENSQ